MPIKIRQTPYTRTGDNPGPFPVFPDRARGDLMVIAMAGTEDLPTTLGEDPPDAADPDFTIVTYDPGPQDTGTDIGSVRQLLKDLVDGGETVRVVAVGPDFLYSDGSTIEDSAGGAIGSLIFYDSANCDGDGRWVRGTDGDEVCTTSAGILYHELSHVHLNHPSDLTSAGLDNDERAAVGVENQLRRAQSLVERDPANWPESDCGCPGGCCIVASVASESPFSGEVQALRKMRDGVLRKTRFGRHLFDAIHSEYYRFSVGVCRVMVMDGGAKDDVLQWLVQPLVRVLRLLVERAEHPGDSSALGRALLEDRDAGFLFAPSSRLGWSGVSRLLRQVSEGRGSLPKVVPIDAGTREVFAQLAAHLPECEHVRWAIVEPLRLYAEARGRCGKRAQADEVGRRLGAELDAWAARVPLGYVMDQMSTAELAAELPELGRTLFGGPAARHLFGARLIESGELEIDARLETRLREEGYLP